MTVQDLLGPGAALALALVMLGLFYSGKILPRNTVPREDYEASQVLVANYAERFAQQTEAVKALTAALTKVAANGNGH